MISLPDPTYYQYVSHMYHENKLIPFDTYTPDTNFNYSEYDRLRFNQILIDNVDYIKDKKILDLGCHAGFMSFVAQYIGAKSCIGVNARKWPVEVGNYFFNQLNINNVKLINENIENFEFLKTVCNQSNTVILASVLGHCRNLEKILSIVSDSQIENVIIESTVIDDDNMIPKLHYYTQDASYDFNGYDGDRKIVLGANPNRKFLETILYFYNWKITKYVVEGEVNLQWFGTPGLNNYPFLRRYVVISATRF